MKNKNQLTLESFATPIASKGGFIKVSFGGFAGAGKTRTATELVIGCYKKMNCSKPVMIIDNEKGARFLEPMFRKAGIKTLVKETTALADVLTAFDFLENGEIDFLFIDSLTKVWYQFIRDYRAQNNRAFMTLQDWGKILPSWQEQFSDRFVSVVGNIVFTGRGGYQYDMEEVEQDNGRKKKEFVKSGVKMKMAGETPFETDLNVWMEQEQELKDGKLHVYRTAQIMKDRSTLIDGKVFIDPTFADFEPVIDFLNEIPIAYIAGQTSKENLAPHENYNNISQRRNTIIAEFTTYFDFMGLGTSKEDKGLKSAILKKMYGFVATENLDAMPIDSLERGVAIMKDFADAYNSYIGSLEGKPKDMAHIAGLLEATMEEHKW